MMTKKSKKQLLLLEDVDGLGRGGDIVTAKPGYIRNFLLPQKKAVIADKSTLALQAKLKEERAQRAIVDKKAAEELAAQIATMTLVAKVKVDPEGKMYGSVTILDIAKLLQSKGLEIHRNNVILPLPLKTTGRHLVTLRLKEGVMAKAVIDIESELEERISDMRA